MKKITIAGLLCILSVLAIPMPAYAQRTTYVLLMDNACDLAMVEYVESQIAVKTGYEQYLPTDFIVACFFGADMKTLDKVSLPLLRVVFPDDYLMFMFPPEDLTAFRDLVSRNGFAPGSAQGFSMFEEGYSLAVLHLDENIHPILKPAYLVDHEAAHTVGCLEHNRESDPVEQWYRPRLASRANRWCVVHGSLVDLAN